MGQKVNPIGLRLGINKTWKSVWCSKKEYANLLHEDLKITKFIKKELKNAGVADVVIERPQGKINVNIYVLRPGMVIGRQGRGIENLKKGIEKITNLQVSLNVVEVKNPELSAELVAQSIASQIEKRISYRRAAKKAIERTMRAGALGIKVRISGRLAGAEIARSEVFSQGRMPLHTLRSDIDYAYVPAFTKYGVIGVRVWIYKGDIFEGFNSDSNTNLMEGFDGFDA
jgi:small subunit ribosomal protein S3